MQKQRALLIAEKPSASKDIEAVYRKMNDCPYEMDFASAAGHLIVLDEPEYYDPAWKDRWNEHILPMIPKKMRYHVDGKCKKLYEQLKEKMNSGRYDYIINACDAGREGELIFDTIYSQAKCKVPALRYWAQDNSDSGIRKALLGLFPAENNKGLLQAAYLRQWQDNLEGINYSRAVSIRAHKGYNVGRIMTAIIAIVTKRDNEVKAFVPKAFYEGILTLHSSGGDFSGKVFVRDGDERVTRFPEKEDVIDLFRNADFEGLVTSVIKKHFKEYAPNPYSLATLQMDAAKILGYDPQQTLNIAQSLYEKKIISYPRTDSEYLPTSLSREIDTHISAVSAVPELAVTVNNIICHPEQINAVIAMSKYVNDAKLTDHYALIPTDMTPDIKSLAEEERNVYVLIARRFLAIFLDPFEYDKLEIVCSLGDVETVSNGTVVTRQGYRTLYKKVEDNAIPLLRKGSSVNVIDADVWEGTTSPPKHYTYDSLIKAMINAGRFVDNQEYKQAFAKSKGLGTSATRAAIIQKLIERDKYIEVQKGKTLVATEKAHRLMTLLEGHDIVKPELTAMREMQLETVADGNETAAANQYYMQMRRTIAEETKELLSIQLPVPPAENQSVYMRGNCPLCGKRILISEKYYRCEGYKAKCSFVLSRQYNGVNITNDILFQLLAGDTIKVTRISKNGRSHSTTIKMAENGKIQFPELEAYYKKKGNQTS